MDGIFRDHERIDGVVGQFAAEMRRQLHANVAKGDWRGTTQYQHSVETFYHAMKLILAMRAGNARAIMEYAADVANHALFVADDFDGLEVKMSSRQVVIDGLGAGVEGWWAGEKDSINAMKDYAFEVTDRLMDVDVTKLGFTTANEGGGSGYER